jgi:hypothetical protein
MSTVRYDAATGPSGGPTLAAVRSKLYRLRRA